MRQIVRVSAVASGDRTRFNINIYHDDILVDFCNVGTMWVPKAIEEAYQRGLEDGKQYVRDQISEDGRLNV